MDKAFTRATLPDGITTIPWGAFSASGLTALDIPEGVTEIQRQAFSSCASLKTVLLPSTLKTIEDIAFYNTSSLKTINLPEGLTQIGTQTFSRSAIQGDIVVPSTVKEIGYNAFDSDGVPNFYFRGPAPTIRGAGLNIAPGTIFHHAEYDGYNVAPWPQRKLSITPTITYTTYLNGNGGSVSGAKAYTYGVGYALPTPSRSGYTFEGWYRTSNFSDGRVYSVTASEMGTKAFYAKWYSNSNYITSMSKSTGTWSKKWSTARTSNTLKLSRSKSGVKLKAKISSKAKVYFKYSGHSYSNVTGKSKTVKVSRGHKKTVYFKVVSQSGKSRTYKIVIKRKR